MKLLFGGVDEHIVLSETFAKIGQEAVPSIQYKDCNIKLRVKNVGLGVTFVLLFHYFVLAINQHIIKKVTLYRYN